MSSYRSRVHETLLRASYWSFKRATGWIRAVKGRRNWGARRSGFSRSGPVCLSSELASEVCRYAISTGLLRSASRAARIRWKRQGMSSMAGFSKRMKNVIRRVGPTRCRRTSYRYSVRVFNRQSLILDMGPNIRDYLITQYDLRKALHSLLCIARADAKNVNAVRSTAIRRVALLG